jgi:hypothetical protein
MSEQEQAGEEVQSSSGDVEENQEASLGEAGSSKIVTGKQETSAPQRLIALAGYALLAGTVAIFAFIAYRSFVGGVKLSARSDSTSLIDWVMTNYFSDILMAFIGVYLSYVGVKLLGKSGTSIRKVIPDEDRDLLAPLIAGKNEEGIQLYVLLSSLSGPSGFFQQIGFVGLPLVTATLTLVFAALSFLDTQFFDLTKLTLGAFIGSFVQKGVDAPKLPSP